MEFKPDYVSYYEIEILVLIFAEFHEYDYVLTRSDDGDTITLDFYNAPLYRSFHVEIRTCISRRDFMDVLMQAFEMRGGKE